MSDSTTPGKGSQSATPRAPITEILPSAGLCSRPWCTQHEMTYYGNELPADVIHARPLRTANGPQGTWGYITTNDDDSPEPGLYLAPTSDFDLWSAVDLRKLAAWILDAADELEAAQAG